MYREINILDIIKLNVKIICDRMVMGSLSEQYNLLFSKGITFYYEEVAYYFEIAKDSCNLEII